MHFGIATIHLCYANPVTENTLARLMWAAPSLCRIRVNVYVRKLFISAPREKPAIRISPHPAPLGWRWPDASSLSRVSSRAGRVPRYVGASI
jgi:hypothetical protein